MTPNQFYVATAIGAVLLVGALAFQKVQLDEARAHIETLDTKLKAETSRADTNAAEVDRLVQINTANEALMKEVRSMRDALNRQSNTLTEAIVNAPPESDGAVAPVLRDALNGLRQSAAQD